MKPLLNVFLFLALATGFPAGALFPQPTPSTEGYHTYDRMSEFLWNLAAESDVVTVKTTGKTLGGREVWVCILSVGIDKAKPAVAVVGGVTGADLAGSEMCLGFIKAVAEGYGTVDSITALLQRTTFYVFPRVNPDASEAFFRQPRYERYLNERPFDLDRDGAVDEDGFDDLDGNGVITMMRIKDQAGDWAPDADFPNLLRKIDRGKGESGMYRLLTEGIDNDKDGRWNEDEPGGVDFNRNFTYRYGFFSRGAGPHQVSEIESRTVADFLFDHPNIAVVFSFSLEDNLLHPWKSTQKSSRSGKNERVRSLPPPTSIMKEDENWYACVSKTFERLTGYSDSPEPEQGHGAFSEWAYYHFGRWSFCVPAWWLPALKDTTQKQSRKDKSFQKNNGAKSVDSRQRRLWKWATATGMKNLFVPWRKIDHPDFPDREVEVGGFVPYAGVNPPADSLEPRSRAYTRFILSLGDMLPRLRISDVKLEPLHDHAYRLTLRVFNDGDFPTLSAMGVLSKIPRKVKVKLELDEDQRIAGGRSLLLLDRIPGRGASRELSWVVLGAKGSAVTVEAGSPSCGIVRRQIVLK